MRPLIATLLTTCLLSAVEVADAFARATAPTQKTGAVFLRLSNSSSSPISLTSASTAVAGTAELHTHIREDGVMKMRAVPTITVPAQGSTTLKPGADHIMLFDLKSPLVEGTTLRLTLTFSDASQTQVEVPVRSADATSADAPKACCQGN